MGTAKTYSLPINCLHIDSENYYIVESQNVYTATASVVHPKAFNMLFDTYLWVKHRPLSKKDRTLKELYDKGDLNLFIALGEYIYQLGLKKNPEFFKSKDYAHNQVKLPNKNSSTPKVTPTIINKDIFTREIEIRNYLSQTPNEVVIAKLENSLSTLKDKELEKAFLEIETQLGLVENSVSNSPENNTEQTTTTTQSEFIGKSIELLPSKKELLFLNKEDFTDELALNLLKVLVDLFYPLAVETVKEVENKYTKTNCRNYTRYLKDIKDKGNAVVWATLHLLSNFNLKRDVLADKNHLLLLDTERAYTKGVKSRGKTQETVYKLLPQGFVWYVPYNYACKYLYDWKSANDYTSPNLYLSYLYFVKDNITEESCATTRLVGGNYKGSLDFPIIDLDGYVPLLLPQEIGKHQREYTDLLLALQDEFLVLDNNYRNYWAYCYRKYNFTKFLCSINKKTFDKEYGIGIDDVSLFLLLVYLLKDEEYDLDSLNEFSYVSVVLLACKKARQFIPGIENIITVENIDENIKILDDWLDYSKEKNKERNFNIKFGREDVNNPILKFILSFYVLRTLGLDKGLDVNFTDNKLINDKIFAWRNGFHTKSATYSVVIKYQQDILVLIRSLLLTK